MSSTKTRRQTPPRRRQTFVTRRKGMGWPGRICWSVAALALALAVWAIVARALAPAANTAQTSFDTLIVLGYPTDSDGNPSPTELASVTEAVHEYERGIAPRIIFTGGAAHNRFVEARAMARAAEAHGIPASVILTDPQALNTIQNACNSVRILRAHGWQSAEVISTPYHLPRAAMIFSRLPLQWRVHAAPPLEPSQSGTPLPQTLLEILKTVRYLVWSRQMEPCQL